MKETQSKTKRFLIGLIVILAILLVAVLVGIIVYLLKNREPENGESNGGVYVLDESNYTQIREEMSNSVEEGYFETYMTTEWIFPDGDSEATDALFGNSPNNKKPIRCEVLLANTNEKVMSTGIIPVGAQLPSIKLDVDLDAGIYEAICMVYLLDEVEDGTYTDYSNTGFNITIIVQE